MIHFRNILLIVACITISCHKSFDRKESCIELIWQKTLVQIPADSLNPTYVYYHLDFINKTNESKWIFLKSGLKSNISLICPPDTLKLYDYISNDSILLHPDDTISLSLQSVHHLPMPHRTLVQSIQKQFQITHEGFIRYCISDTIAFPKKDVVSYLIAKKDSSYQFSIQYFYSPELISF